MDPARTILVGAAASALALAGADAASAAKLTSSPALGPPIAQAEDLGPSTPTVSIKTSSLGAAEVIARRHGVTVHRSFPWIDWYELTSPEGTIDGREFARVLADDPAVRDTDALAPGERLLPQFKPRDSAWSFSHPTVAGVGAQWHWEKVNFPAAWDVAKGAGVNIGIVDSEFDTTHPELSSKVRNPYNTASGSANYHTGDLRAENAQQLHGTHVAGIAAASTDDGIGVSGGGFDAVFTPVRVNTSFQPGTGQPVDMNFVTDLTEALGYLQGQGIAVVNMSLGATRSHQPLADAIAALRAQGVTIVAAAGNFQQTNPNAPIYPASYPGVIAVANTQSNNTINPTSSNGSWVDVAAPGTEILSSWDARAPQLSFPGETGNYHSISGTSMAAPVVTGLVALMKSVRPDLTPDEVESLLKGTVTDLGSSGPDPQFGAGLINAFAAVNAASAYVRPVPPAPPAPPAPPVAPAPAVPSDTAAPRVSVSGLVQLSRSGRRVTVRIKCNERCSGRVRLRVNAKRKKSRKLLGSVSFKNLKANRYKAIRVTSERKLKVSSRIIVEVAAYDGARNMATNALTRKLRR